MRTFLTLSQVLWATLAFTQNLYFPPLNSPEWARLEPEELSWCADKVDSLIRFAEEKNTRAFIILKDGKIVVEEYFGTYTQDSLWYWASAGKSLMGGDDRPGAGGRLSQHRRCKQRLPGRGLDVLPAR